jgi:ATP-dependent helicase HrpB
VLDPASPLSQEAFITVADLAGSASGARVLAAAAITRAEIEHRFADAIAGHETVAFDTAAMALRARRSRRLGALVLSDDTLPVRADDAAAATLAAGIAAAGIDRLPISKALQQWRERVAFLRGAEGEEWPDLSDAALSQTAADWLTPFITGKTALAQIGAADVDAAMRALLDHRLARRLDAEAPTHFRAPSGSVLPIDYSRGEPILPVRVQELFGLDRHPLLASGRTPLVLELLSPAHRPVQVTRDLPGFWRGSWTAVRAEMRGRYPRHPWPEDPAAALATSRAKPRGT